MRRRVEGAPALREALRERASIPLVLVRAGNLDPASAGAVGEARAAGAAVREVTAAVLRRFSGGQPADVLALVGPSPVATLGELMARDGVVWLLAGVAYPGNAGFAIRTAEVSGAAGIVLDSPLVGRGRRAAERASMQAQRLFPVLWQATGACIDAARAAGRRIVVLEDGGGAAPADVDLRGRPLIVVGGERDGLPPEALAAADERVCIPMAGFIPSYNLQGAMAVVAAACAAASLGRTDGTP